MMRALASSSPKWMLSATRLRDLVLHRSVVRHELHRIVARSLMRARSIRCRTGGRSSPRSTGCGRARRACARSADPQSSACSNGVSAPSSFTSAHANGRSSGCVRSGSGTHAARSITPSDPTSTISDAASPVSGSYSNGGTSTRPPAVRTPTTRRSRRPVRNAPITGPTLRRYGNSSFQVAATPCVLPHAGASAPGQCRGSPSTPR